MATATKHTWEPHLELESTKGGKVWHIQKNEVGQFRCDCPSFIFSRVSPRACKHTRFAESETGGKATTSVAATVAQTGASSDAFRQEALAIFGAMCAEATKATRSNIQQNMGVLAARTMVNTLAAKLAAYAPPSVAVEVSVTTVGVRRIVFDD
jgi:hypothetical protein